MPVLDCRSSVRDGAAVLSLHGMADHNGVDALSGEVQRLIREHPRLVILDLAGLVFLASLAIGQIITLHNGLKAHGGQVRIAAANHNVDQVLTRCRLSDIMAIKPTIDDALKA